MPTDKAKLLSDFVGQQTAGAPKRQGSKPVHQHVSKAVKRQSSKPVPQEARKSVPAEYVRATFYVEAQDFKQFKLKAVALDRDYSDCIREAMADWLKR
jgi:hypothetical protein